MSADSMATCPICYKNHKKEELQLKRGYGKLTQKAFTSLQKKVNDFNKYSLEERYELYIVPETQVFIANYRCTCSVCGYTFSFYQEIPAKDESESENGSSGQSFDTETEEHKE